MGDSNSIEGWVAISDGLIKSGIDGRMCAHPTCGRISASVTVVASIEPSSSTSADARGFTKANREAAPGLAPDVARLPKGLDEKSSSTSICTRTVLFWI